MNIEELKASSSPFSFAKSAIIVVFFVSFYSKLERYRNEFCIVN